MPRSPKRGPLLTKKRQAYVDARSGGVFLGTTLNYNAAVQERYVRELSGLTTQMTAQCTREINRLFKTEAATVFFATDASISSQARILVNSLSDRFNALFAKQAKPIAERMVAANAAASKSALHSSLQKLSGGLSLKTSMLTPDLQDIYKASVAMNVSLIKSIAAEYLQKVQGAVMRSITSGNGLQDLVPALQAYEGQTHRRAKNIALDQTRKVYNGINRGRMEAIGLEEFKWHHSGGSAHPREDHIAMDGNTYRFDDPPVIDENTGETGIPGDAINCRCTMSPVFKWAKDKTE